jgi:DNA-binding response OmpR family regulator
MRKILIIEDEPNIRELVSYNLKMGGFLPLEAEDGIVGQISFCSISCYPVKTDMKSAKNYVEMEIKRQS